LWTGSERAGRTVRKPAERYRSPMDLGPAELLIILLVVLVLFGGAKLPQLARSLGQAKNEFERGTRGEGKPEAPTEP
ncbi:MAG: sec-independent protein translocase protein TatA, partial [Acidimicrobiaceae bacterium]